MSAFAGKRRLRVLFFSQRFPLPMDTGGKIRTGKMLEKLKHIFDVTLISNMESPRDGEHVSKITNLCSEFYPVPWNEIKKYSPRFYLRVLYRILSRYPVTVINDYSEALEEKISDILRSQRYDLVVCDFLQPSLNVRNITGYPTLLFQHNVESIIMERYFRTARDPLRKLFWRSQWKKMLRYEQQACRRFTGVVAVSEVDKENLEKNFSLQNVFAIPTGVDTEYFSPREEAIEPNSLVFTGSMDWLPNEDAILFFAQEILGQIKEHIPNVTLTVVGRNPSRRLLHEVKNYPEINVVGWVSDVRPYIGGGTRIKAYEAMAMGKAVVSTHVGTEGLPLTSGQHAVLTDEPRHFAAAVVELLRDHKKRQYLGETARNFVQQNFAWERVAEIFAGICERVVRA
jgi:glycosyltransferase involved in cell wall biosynthesis